MKGAIFFSGQYGSTEQYAKWIAEETGLPIFDASRSSQDPSEFDFLVIGTSVIVYKLSIRHWIQSNYDAIRSKPTVMFTVSGASAGPKLDAWIAQSLPSSLVSTLHHVALRGRMNPKALNWWTRLFMMIGAWKNNDPQARKEELEGFDYVEKAGIEPIVAWIRQHESESPAGATQSVFQ